MQTFACWPISLNKINSAPVWTNVTIRMVFICWKVTWALYSSLLLILSSLHPLAKQYMCFKGNQITKIFFLPRIRYFVVACCSRNVYYITDHWLSPTRTCIKKKKIAKSLWIKDDVKFVSHIIKPENINRHWTLRYFFTFWKKI